MKREPIRIILVGAGVRGAMWARVIGEASDAMLVGVVDHDEGRARRARDRYAPRALVARDLEAVLVRADADAAAVADADAVADANADPDPDATADAVVIATPPATHHSLVSRALDHGLHVLCEKPLSDDLDEVVDLIARAGAARRRLLVGMNFRYLPSSQRIRGYVRQGHLGAPSHAHFTYHRQRDGNRDDLNDYVMSMAHPMLLEQSVHHFDLLRHCYDSEVESLVCDTWRPSWSTYAGDCCVSVLFRFENGLRANYLGTWTAAWNRMDFRWRTDFERGALIQREQFDDLVRVDFDRGLGLRGPNFKGDADAETPVAEPLAPCTPFVDDTRGLLAEFVGAVRGELDPVTTGGDHLETLLMVHGCIESLRRGEWVAMRDLRRRWRVASGATRLVRPGAPPGPAP